MAFLYDVFAVLHFIGWAVVLGGYVASLRSPGLYRGVFHGAATALVAGVAMVGLYETGETGEVIDNPKIGIKLAVTVVVTVLAFFASRQSRKGDNGTGPVAPGLKHSIAALTLVNVVVATFVAS